MFRIFWNRSYSVGDGSQEEGAHGSGQHTLQCGGSKFVPGCLIRRTEPNKSRLRQTSKRKRLFPQPIYIKVILLQQRFQL